MKRIQISKWFQDALLVTGFAALSFSCSDDQNEAFEDMNLQLGSEYVVEVQGFDVPGSDEVIVDHAKGTITVVFPCGSDVSAVSSQVTLATGAVISPTVQTIDLTTAKDVHVSNGNVFKRYKISADIRCVTGFLSHATTRFTIRDDDEKAYADWFFSTYKSEVAEFVSFADIKAGTVDLSKYKTLTWYLDGDETENYAIPEIALDTDVLSKLTAYYKSGGNFYLLGYAGRYLIEMGRFPADKYFVEKGDGPGFENGDTWGVGTSIMGKDESAHPVFAGITLTAKDNKKTFPVIGPGWRENHNYVVVRIPEVYGLNNDNPAAYDKFNQDNSTRWLGVWDGIGDFFMVGIMELMPKGDYQGTAIFQGIGGLEWNQNKKGDVNPKGINAHRTNIELLAKNSISYLIVN